jgi:Flp pilus assembly protein TadD
VRRLVLVVLLVGYVAVFVRLPSFGRGGRAFEPLGARGREAETAIEEQRFADALPIVRDLAAEHASDPVIAYWLAEVHRGLGHVDDEAKAWEHVFELTASADFACPSLPEAYTRAGDREGALRAYERCASAGTDDPERWLDLGAAYGAAGRPTDAAAAYEKSRTLDGSNPRLPMPTLPGHGGESQRAAP